MSLQDLSLDILLEIAKLHPWIACELSKTIRKVGLYSLDHDVKKWFKVEKEGDTFILVKSSKKSYHKKLYHSWDDKPAEIYSNGSQYWYKIGKLHRDGDKPAEIEHNGARAWFKEGKLHRDGDKPAAIHSNGTIEWYKEDKKHRDGDKPAMIYHNGTKEWYKEDKMFRDDGKPAVIHPNDIIPRWYKEYKKWWGELGN